MPALPFFDDEAVARHRPAETRAECDVFHIEFNGTQLYADAIIYRKGAQMKKHDNLITFTGDDLFQRQ
jgi:hypothetical protein